MTAISARGINSNPSTTMKHLKQLLLVITLLTLAANHAAAVDVTWAVGSGNWGTTTANWKNNALVATTYLLGQAVLFEDKLSGTSPLLVTNTLNIGACQYIHNNYLSIKRQTL